MAIKTLNITLEFLQNQLNNTSFGYQIRKNGAPITYTGTSYVGTVDNVNKTFKSNNNTSNKRLMSLNSDLSPNVEDCNTISGGFNGEVNVIRRQSTGKYIIAGSFTSYQGNSLTFPNICRLNEDYTIDNSFTPPTFPEIIYNLEVDGDDKIYIGGYSIVGGKQYLHRLNQNGVLDTLYMNGIGFNGPVTAIKLQSDGKLLVAGIFTTFSTIAGGTITANRLIRLNLAGEKDTSFNGVVQGFTNSPGFVVPRTIDLQSDGKIIVGGDFNKYNNITCGNIIHLTSTGAIQTVPFALDTPVLTSRNVTKVLVDSSDNIYVTGEFTRVGGNTTLYPKRIIKLDNLCIPISTFNTGAGQGFERVGNDMTFNTDGNLVVVGNFFTYNNVSTYVPQMVVLDKTDGSLSPDGEISGGWQGPQFGINAVYYNNTGYVIGGPFTSYNNPNVYDSQFVVPISGTSTQTQQKTFDNLSFWNKNNDIVYTQIDNVIKVAYTYDDIDLIAVSAFDIPNYLIIRVDGENIPSVVKVDNYPQSLTPAYNPITFNISSNYSVYPSFRYLVNLYNQDSNELIAKFKLAPQLDNTGYIDLSKIISNSLTVDFTPNEITNSDCVNSYINYKVGFGAEYGSEWRFSNVKSYDDTPGSIYTGYTNLYQTNLIGHTYVTGDQIVIESNSNTPSINGLHTIVEVYDDFSIVIDLPFVEGTNLSTSGVTTYADNRKTSFTDDIFVTGLTAFNGARSWMDFINWRGVNYTIIDLTNASKDIPKRFLSNIPFNGFSVTYSQDLYLNFFNQYDNENIKLKYQTSNGETGSTDSVSGITKVMSFAAGPTQLGIPQDNQWYEIFLIDETSTVLSQIYKINLDNRCKIEDYEILFMDRMGSLVSYAFQLRAIEKGMVEREKFKQNVNYKLNNSNYFDSYDINGRGDTISNVSLMKEYELNTNWMTDEMSVYFEELVSSPYTWIKIGGIYYSCMINDTDFEVTRQKNKQLIKKTITVRLSNDNVINI